MKFLAGLMDHQVLQRNSKNVSETLISGQCENAGTLTVRATKKGKPVPGFSGKMLITVKHGEFSLTLTGLPVGGPYRLDFQIIDAKGKILEKCKIDDLLVGDVWILGGQSNMEGIGLLKDAIKAIPTVRAFYMNDRWAPARDPIHNLGQAVDPVHADLNGGKPVERGTEIGVGPGVGFGQAMYKFSGVPQGLLACGHGGTSMSQWDPALKNIGNRSLYGATLRRVRANGSRVAGIVWYQGCSDTNYNDAPKYTERMKNLVASFRTDLNNPNLPFVMVQIATYFPTVLIPEQEQSWTVIQEQERQLPKVIKNLATVPAVDLELDDCIHISGVDQHRLGRRLAEAAWTIMKGKKALKPPIELKSVKFISDTGRILLTFDHVEGKLRAAGRPSGFSLRTPEGIPCPAIYRADLDKNTVTIRTGLSPETEETSLRLFYGYGPTAYCNITDEADRSLPVFGPVNFAVCKEPRQVIRIVRVSKILPGAGKLEAVACPDTSDPTLAWTQRTFPTSFYNLHDQLQSQTNDAVVYYASKFRCPEPMKLQVGFGYDGPVKAWINGREVYHDPNGINPMIFDQFKFDYDATAGEHEIVVAFSANFGAAWGIALRLYRTDLAKELIAKGPDHYKLPEILG